MSCVKRVPLQFFAEGEPAREDVFEEQRAQMNSAFDVPSPLLAVGGVEESAPAADPAPLADGGGAAVGAQEEGGEFKWPLLADEGGGGSGGDGAAGGVPPAESVTLPVPFKVLKTPDGREVPFASEADYERAALAGLGAGDLRQRVVAYEPFLSAMETDMGLAQTVLGAIQQYRSGRTVLPATAPQAEDVSGGTEADAEPVQGADESFEAFETRHAEWERKRYDRDIEQRVDNALRQRQEREYSSRVQAVQQRVFAGVQQDAVGRQVMSSVMDRTMPPALRELCERDPSVFMCVYDAMRMLQGHGGYYGSPVCYWNGRQGQAGAVPSPSIGVPPQGGMAGGVPAPAAQPGAPVQIKGQSAPAPFVEGAGGRVSAQRGFPSVNDMSDEQFKTLQRQIEASFMNGRL